MIEYFLNKKDLETIVDRAKGRIVKFNLPLHISGKEVEVGELPTLAILEATLMILNSKKLLTSTVSIDYTDPTADHDQELPLEPKRG